MIYEDLMVRSSIRLQKRDPCTWIYVSTDRFELGGRVFILSCNLRFEVYRFYDPIADAPPPSPPPEVSPSPSTNISSTKGKESNKFSRTVIIIVVVLIISICIYLRVRKLYSQGRNQKLLGTSVMLMMQVSEKWV
ncbi:cysteine-rich receptor-like protein kinase 25 isoform X2 [Alnus glutinosa]|uniref:cysteine-rich receptor-like protein kinase 25 isoform X2 n=1 Tax=Alnus glutinosa TaxID=3517 RepID=UPI002D78CB46|nr:cysteine-rich receptor-like protein kinase 25 isoform X2 [Alnus glutinosa]